MTSRRWHGRGSRMVGDGGPVAIPQLASRPLDGHANASETILRGKPISSWSWVAKVCAIARTLDTLTLFPRHRAKISRIAIALAIRDITSEYLVHCKDPLSWFD